MRQGRLFVFGLGYSAMAVAARLDGQGWRTAGTVRDRDKAAALRAEGLDAHVYGGSDASAPVRAALADATHILVSVPPVAEGCPVLRDFSGDIGALAPGLKWLGYLSTVGVYGDRRGGEVDEKSLLQPSSERGLRRLEAERGWSGLALQAGIPLAVFRIAGIYGPGRNQLESVLAGTAKRIVKPGQVFNRIHVDDIAACVIASMKNPPEGVRAYNLADDEPAPPADVVAYAARLLGRDPPAAIPFEKADLTPMARSFYGESKRVGNARIKTELGVTLKYPTYREGLKALLADLNLKR